MTGRYATLTIDGAPRVVDLLALPRVTIDTGGTPILNTEDYVPGTITIAGRGALATRPVEIRGRGNSTWEAPKKPYRLKLGTAASLVPGVPADRDWVLLANYYDPSSVRTAIAMELGYRCSGLDWTPRFRYVWVTLNGTALGLYQLGEHVKVGANRINIPKPGSATSGLALTGGYSMEIDQRLEAKGDPGFRTALNNLPISLADPDGSVPQQAAYIQNWINNFEATLFGPDWLNPATGYARLIDRDSFIDWYLVNELTANLDSNFFSSCKLFKTRDTASTPGRLHMGPLWDFDNSSGNSFRSLAIPPTGFWVREPSEGGIHPGAMWFARMFEDPSFAAAAWARWQTLAATLGDLDEFTDDALKRIWPAAQRDQKLWGFSEDRAAVTTQVTGWLTARIAWLNGALAV